MRSTTPFLQPAPWLGATVEIETRWIAPERAVDVAHPPIVYLHEGLGSLAQWRDFPQRLCDAAGCRGLAFSRPGYGRSTPRTAAWPRDYLQEQARALAGYFDSLELGSERLFLFGHSDGASLALLFAAYFPERVCGVAALAPHLFIEDITIENLRRAKESYEEGSLRRGLARYHADTESAFYGWNDAWLNPGFRQWNIEADLRTLSAPVLALQGVDDEYATLAQIEAIARIHADTELCALDACGHSPQRDRPDDVIARTLTLLARCGSPSAR